MDKITERLAAIADEAQELRDQMEAAIDADDFDAEAFAALEGRAADLATEKDQLEERQAKIAKVEELAARGNTVDGYSPPNPKVLIDRTSETDIYDLSSIRMGAPKSELRGRAVRAVEQVAGWEMTDARKQQVVEYIERKDDKQGNIAKHVLATGSATYKDAWAKAITGRDALLSGTERDALARAMSLTDAAGGFAVPFPIDPTLILLSEGSANPLRRIGRVEPITTDSWQGVASSAVTAAFSAEATEASDNTPTWSQPQVSAEKAQAFIPASIEIAQDYPGLAEDLVEIFMDAKDTLESTAMVTGTGTNEPIGIVTAVTAGATSSATTDVFAVEDVYTIHETLGNKYRSNATWLANIAIINDIRQFGTVNNFHAFTQDLSGAGPRSLLGRPVEEASGMDGTVTALSDNYVLLFGDFRNFLIADRVGFTVQYIPFLTGGTNRYPTGQVGWYAYWRVGSDSINDNAFELLNVT